MTFDEFKEAVIADLPQAAEDLNGFKVTNYGYKFSTALTTVEYWYNTAQQKLFMRHAIR